MNKKLTKIAGLSLGIAMAIGVGVALSRGERDVEGVKAAAGDEYVLVTDVATLEAGKTIVIGHGTSGTTNLLSTTQNSNNRGQTGSVTITSGKIDIPADAQEIVLGKNGDNWTFSVGTGYLYAASSSKNYLRTQATNNANGYWAVTINASGVATAIAQGSNTNNNLKYNSGNSIFSCYSGGQESISIWMKNEATKVLDSISLGTTGVKTVYETGDTLDTTNLTVTAHYVGGETKDVTDKATIVPPDMTVAGNDKPVNVSYTESGVTKDANYLITVNASKTLKSVAISGQATAVKNGEWNLDNLVVTGTASDDSDMGDITDKCELTSSNSTDTLGEQHITVHVNYKEGEWEGDVEDVEAYVEDKPLSSELVPGTNGYSDAGEETALDWKVGTETQTKQAYLSGVSYSLAATDQYSGKTFNNTSSPTGKDWRFYQSGAAALTISIAETYDISKITFVYLTNNGGTWLDSSDVEVASGVAYNYGLGNSVTFHVSNSGSATNGQIRMASITVEYKAAAPKVLESLEIKEQPTKTIYSVGEDFDPEGMVVVAHYNEERTAVVTDYDWDPKTIAADTTKVVVSYTEDGVTKTADVEVTAKVIQNITGVKSMPEKIYRSEVLALTDVVLTAEYNDGSTTEVNPTSIVLNTSVAGTVTATFTFAEATGTKSVEQEVTVLEATRWVKSTSLPVVAKTLMVADGGIMMNSVNSGGRCEILNIADNGKMIGDNTVLVNYNSPDYIEFQIIPITSGTYAGRYYITFPGQLGRRTYLAYDSSGFNRLNNVDSEGLKETASFEITVDPVTGEAIIQNDRAKQEGKHLRRNRDYGFSMYTSGTSGSYPVTFFVEDTYEATVRLDKTSFTGYVGQSVKVYASYQHLDEPLVPSVEEGSATVTLISEESSANLNVYNISFDGASTGYIMFADQRFDFTAAADSVKSIAVKTQPTKLIYDIDEEFDKTGLVVEATYVSGKTETVDNSLIEVSGFDSSARADSQKVTLTYGEKTAFVYVDIVPTVKGLRIDASEAQTTYYVGDTVNKFNRDSLKVYNVYTDDSEVQIYDWEIGGWDSSTTGTRIVTIYDPNPEHPGSQGIYLTFLAVADDHLRVVAPTKTEYVIGQELSTAGMEVYLVKNNGDETQLEATQYEIEGFDSSTAGDFEATVKYKENNEIVGKFAYTVVEKCITSANISSAPKQDYFVGETVPTDQWHIHAWYNDGTDRALEASEYQVEYPDMSTPGEKAINISIPNPNGATNPIVMQWLITVHAIQLESIHITQFPTKTEYWAGEELDLTGLKVKKRMNNTDESWLNVEDLVLTGYDMNTPGNQTVTVSYTEDGITKSDTFNITVKAVNLESIAVTTKPEKLTYYVGEELDLTGIVVTGTYTDGHTAEITNFTNDPVNMDEVGTATVTIRVGDKMTTFDIEIVNRPAPAKRGCGGSIAATSALLSLVAVGGIALISLKKRKEK